MPGERQEYKEYKARHSFKFEKTFALLLAFGLYGTCRMIKMDDQRIEDNKKFCAKFSSEKGEECPAQCQGVFTSGKETGDCSCFKESKYAQIPGRCLSPKMSGASK